MLDQPIYLYAWMFVIGSVVGSFLNVVIYRMPRGMSLLAPSSHCPKCRHAIRWYDNVPILSWLWLGRRCRDCGTTIPARYPLVEAVTGLMFVALAHTDVVVPYQIEVSKAAAAAANAEQADVSISTADLFAAYAFH